MSAQSDQASLGDALAAIDAANAHDPNLIDGRPRALVQGERATHWLHQLEFAPPPALSLAARAHHLRRWTIPRDSYPDGRGGYLRWRRDLKDVHASALGQVVPSNAVSADVLVRAQELVAKRPPVDVPDAQAFEDVVCLVFLETQYEALIDKLDDQKIIAVLRKTLPKMSSAGIALAGSAQLHPRGRELLEQAAVSPSEPSVEPEPPQAN